MAFPQLQLQPLGLRIERLNETILQNLGSQLMNTFLGKNSLLQQDSFHPNWNPRSQHISNYRVYINMCGPMVSGFIYRVDHEVN